MICQFHNLDPTNKTMGFEPYAEMMSTLILTISKTNILFNPLNRYRCIVSLIPKDALDV